MKWDLEYFKTGEWQVIEERLADLTAAGIQWCPGENKMFAAMNATPFDKVKVVIMGQDPYPNPLLATGIAFAVPDMGLSRPPTLLNIFKELKDDLDVTDADLPSNSLKEWTDQGVFLWNSVPTCTAFQSKSHAGWTEYVPLTEEIVKKLDEKGVVFTFLGQGARYFSKFVKASPTIELGHPSPLAVMNTRRNPFFGSRMFSTINAKLNEKGLGPINWRI